MDFMVGKFDKWLVFVMGKTSCYSCRMALESAPEAAKEALKKNAG
jgi:hypothetical protein